MTLNKSIEKQIITSILMTFNPNAMCHLQNLWKIKTFLCVS